MQNAAPVVKDDEEAVEHLKGEGGHSKEICGGDGLPMILEKHCPALSRFRAFGRFALRPKTVLSEISAPSILSSPWILGAPHVGFSATMRKMSSLSSLLIRFLPTTVR